MSWRQALGLRAAVWLGLVDKVPVRVGHWAPELSGKEQRGLVREAAWQWVLEYTDLGLGHGPRYQKKRKKLPLKQWGLEQLEGVGGR